MDPVRIAFMGAGKRALYMHSRIVAALPELVATAGVWSRSGESALDAVERCMHVLAGMTLAPEHVF